MYNFLGMLYYLFLMFIEYLKLKKYVEV